VIKQVLDDLLHVYFHVHLNEVKLFQLIEYAAICKHLGKVGITDITIMKYELRNLSLSILQIVSQVLNMLIKMNPGQTQRMEFLLVHLNEFGNEIRSIEAHVLQGK